MPIYPSKIRLLLAMLLLAVVVTSAASAQTRNRVDNRGKEFRLAFLHTNGYDDYPRLAIIIGNEKPTRGTITYLSSGKRVPIVLGQSNGVTRVDLDTFDLLLPDPRRTPISQLSLLLEFDDEVVVYGVNTQRWSTDCFLALPKDVTGQEHIILSYPNTLSPDPAAGALGGSDFPSQFAVIATEDSTLLEVEPSVRISSRPDNFPFTIKLNKGQVYFAQAFGRIGQDLTGTHLKANYPVIVYGSHQRTNIPYDQAVGRDHLVEQLPPVDRWGTRIFVTPHFQLMKTLPDANIFRVIAANDNTILKIDSVYYATLRARQMVELPLDRAMEITANGPIMAAQYQHSTADEKFIKMPNDSIGDPFMMLANPPAQFDSMYWFESLQTKDFKFHFVNVVIPTERIGTLLLDGFPTGASFSRIANTSYSYAQITVRTGYHVIRASAPFGLYIYGYGPYNSYGYPGALVFDTLFKDQKPPDLLWRDTCNGVVGALVDDSLGDFGVESLRLGDRRTNVTLSTDPFRRGDDSLRFHLMLVDPFQDGSAELIGVDTAGLDRHYNIDVKGFTVALYQGQTKPEVLDTLGALNGLEFCTSFTLRNYGRFPQSVQGLRLNSNAPGLRVLGAFPMDLAPGESREISICYRHIGDTSFTLDVAIDNGCLQRPVIRLPIISGIDSLTPRLSSNFGPCDADRTIIFTEDGALNSGVQSVVPVILKNATITISPLPDRQVEVRIVRIDPYKDMIYSLTITDRVGNTITVTDTIGGFTIAVRSATLEQIAIRLDRPWQYQNLIYGDEKCDTFYLENYGIRTLQLHRPRILGNIEYSIPPEQLPIVLRPGERRPLLICIHPRGSGERIDTLAIDFECGSIQELVELRTTVNALDGVGGDRCGNQLRFQVDGFAKRNFLQAPSPNPARGDGATVTFGLDAPQGVTLAIYSNLGSEMQRLLDNDAMPGGIVQIDVDISDLPGGTYYLRMMTSTGTLLGEKFVISR